MRLSRRGRAVDDPAERAPASGARLTVGRRPPASVILASYRRGASRREARKEHTYMGICNVGGAFVGVALIVVQRSIVPAFAAGDAGGRRGGRRRDDSPRVAVHDPISFPA